MLGQFLKKAQQDGLVVSLYPAGCAGYLDDFNDHWARIADALSGEQYLVNLRTVIMVRAQKSNEFFQGHYEHTDRHTMENDTFISWREEARKLEATWQAQPPRESKFLRFEMF